MDTILIRKKDVQRNAALRKNQKAASGGGLFHHPKDRDGIAPFVSLADETLLDLAEKADPVSNATLSSCGTDDAAKRCPFLPKVLSFPEEDRVLVLSVLEKDPARLEESWLFQHREDAWRAGLKALQEILHPKKRLYRPDTLNQILSEDLHLSLSPKDNPAFSGILVCSMQDLVLLAEGSPDDRYLTAADLVTGKARIVRAAIGTSLSSVLTRALPPEPNTLLFAGRGALRGHRIRELEVLTGDTALFLAKPVSFSRTFVCIGCGDCIEVCPAKLPIISIMKLREFRQIPPGKPEMLCLYCGLCAFVCRTGINTEGYVASLAEGEKKDNT
ncbi:MAG: 4Fe-4S dicluster domain-containing protein [Lachnospiraceae bacterium]|jgi:ferredoxin